MVRLEISIVKRNCARLPSVHLLKGVSPAEQWLVESLLPSILDGLIIAVWQSPAKNSTNNSITPFLQVFLAYRMFPFSLFSFFFFLLISGSAARVKGLSSVEQLRRAASVNFIEIFEISLRGICASYILIATLLLSICNVRLDVLRA